MNRIHKLSKKNRQAAVKEMINRMALAYGIKRSELPSFLKTSKQAVSNWGYYARIPYEYLHTCSDITGKSMEWLIYGKSCMEAAETVTVISDGANTILVEASEEIRSYCKSIAPINPLPTGLSEGMHDLKVVWQFEADIDDTINIVLDCELIR